MADSTPQGVQIFNTPQGGSAAPTINFGLTGFVGPASWGIPGQLYPVSIESDLTNAVGNGSVTTAGLTPETDLVAEVLNFLDVQGTDGSTTPMFALVTRVVDGDDTAAVLNVIDTTAVTPKIMVELTGASTGSRANGATYEMVESFNWTETVQFFDFTINFPYGVTQTWSGLAASKLTDGTSAYDQPTLAASIVAAVNHGNNGQVASFYFVATLGETLGTTAPVTNTLVPVTTLGTDGATNLTTEDLVGTSSDAGSTGLQALQGQGIFQFCIAGLTDPTADAAIATFAQNFKSLGLSLVPSGTTTATAIATEMPVPSIYLAKAIDFIRVSPNGDLVSPMGTMLGEISLTPPWISIANKPREGFTTVLSSERYPSNPLGETEEGQRQTAGLLYLGQNMPRGGRLWGFPHGQNTSGIQFQDTVQYTRMTNYLELLIKNALGAYVGENQGTSANDILRSGVTGSLKGLFNPMVLAQQIDDFEVTDDLTNNSQPTIALGQNFAAVSVEYFEAVRDFFVNFMGGSNVVVTSATSTTST